MSSTWSLTDHMLTNNDNNTFINNTFISNVTNYWSTYDLGQKKGNTFISNVTNYQSTYMIWGRKREGQNEQKDVQTTRQRIDN